LISEEVLAYFREIVIQVTIKGNRHLQYGEKCCNFAKVIALQN